MSLDLNLPPIVGHRGTAGLAPENTLAGIRRAHEEGARWVEVDVKLTADAVPILMHDDRLGRTTDGKGKVASTTLADIQRLDAGGWFDAAFAGERVPTLQAALELCIELGLGINIELKPCPGREVETARLALQTLADVWPDGPGLPRPLISSFDRQALTAAQRWAPDLPRGGLVTRPSSDWRAKLRENACSTLNVSNRWIRRKHIDAATAAGVPVLVYTVNDPERARTLWAAGVTSIFTDRVDLMVAAMQDQPPLPMRGTGADQVLEGP